MRGYGSNDITFCAQQNCRRKKCERNLANVVGNPVYVSITDWEGSAVCLKVKKQGVKMEEEKILLDFINEIKRRGVRYVSAISKVAVTTLESWVNRKAVPTLVHAQKVALAMGLEFLLFEKED